MYLKHTERPLSRAAVTTSAAQQRMESIRELLELEQTRIDMTASLSSVFERIQRLQTDLMQSSETVRNQFAVNAGTKPSPLKHLGYAGVKRRMRRGELRSRIVEFLRAAGSNGAKVREIADALGVKPVNIHSWFHTATQRFPQLKRFAPGRYRLESEFQKDDAPRLETPKARRNRALPKTPRGKRGEVSKRILEVLQNADPEGIRVAEIAEKVGAKYRNVHVWLSSIGKRDPRIIRSGRGIYRMKREPVIAEPAAAVL